MLWDMLIINKSRSTEHIHFQLDIIKALKKISWLDGLTWITPL